MEKFKKVSDALQFSGDKIPNRIRGKTRWFNLYDPHDSLGYPLKVVIDAYDRVVLMSVPCRAAAPSNGENSASR